MAETEAAAALHLAEDQRQPGRARLRSNNVDFPKAAAPIALQDLHALPLQFGAGQILAAYADLPLRFCCRHRPPPHGSMRTPALIVQHRSKLWKPRNCRLWKPPVEHRVAPTRQPSQDNSWA